MSDECVKPFVGIQHELSISEDGLVLRGSKIVMPSVVQSSIIQIGHEGHQGPDKTKQLINQFVWFPCVNWLVESYIKKCKVCQANSEKCQFEPLKVSKMPNGLDR